MSFVIDDPKTNELVQRLAAETGESMADAVRHAVEDRLSRVHLQPTQKKIDWNAVRQIQQRVAAAPVLDARPWNELLDYGDSGTFH